MTENYEIKTHPKFDKEFNKLIKKCPSLEEDFNRLKKSIIISFKRWRPLFTNRPLSSAAKVRC